MVTLWHGVLFEIMDGAGDCGKFLGICNILFLQSLPFLIRQMPPGGHSGCGRSSPLGQ